VSARATLVGVPGRFKENRVRHIIRSAGIRANRDGFGEGQVDQTPDQLLPVPDSPWRQVVVSRGATWVARLSTARHAGELPSIRHPPRRSSIQKPALDQPTAAPLQARRDTPLSDLFAVRNSRRRAQRGQHPSHDRPADHPVISGFFCKLASRIAPVSEFQTAEKRHVSLEPALLCL
jgi:hypothetical protein